MVSNNVRGIAGNVETGPAEVVGVMMKTLDLQHRLRTNLLAGVSIASFVSEGRGRCWQDKIRARAWILEESSNALEFCPFM